MPLSQIARYNEQDGSSSGPRNRSLVGNAEDEAEEKLNRNGLQMQDGQGTLTGTRTAIVGHEGDAATRPRETEEWRADLEAARNEVACYAGEVQKSKELEALVRDELHTAQLALRQSELKVAELNGNLASAEHEKTLSTAAAEELRLESARLKRTMEVVHSAADGHTMRDISDALTDELKELRTQLAAMAQERWVEHTQFRVARLIYYCTRCCSRSYWCTFWHGRFRSGTTAADVTNDAGRVSTCRWGL